MRSASSRDSSNRAPCRTISGPNASAWLIFTCGVGSGITITAGRRQSRVTHDDPRVFAPAAASLGRGQGGVEVTPSAFEVTFDHVEAAQTRQRLRCARSEFAR